MSSSEPLSLDHEEFHVNLELFLLLSSTVGSCQELFNIYPNAIKIKKVFKFVIEYCKI